MCLPKSSQKTSGKEATVLKRKLFTIGYTGFSVPEFIGEWRRAQEQKLAKTGSVPSDLLANTSHRET